jgi:hypothetical protein
MGEFIDEWLMGEFIGDVSDDDDDVGRFPEAIAAAAARAKQ